MKRRTFPATALALATAFAFAFGMLATPAQAQKKYDTGASDTEIKLGQTMPYSGPMSAYGIEGRVQEAYFKMINDKGGINGRKVVLMSVDDSFTPPKTVEQTRKLVEGEEVLAMVSIMGTAQNVAVQKYLNSKKVPQLMALTGYSKMEDAETAPWTTSFMPSYHAEGRVFAKYILDNKPNAKLGALVLNGDVGRDFMGGLREGLAAKAATMIVKETSFEMTDTTIDSQILSLQAAGVDTLVLVTVGKFPAQAIRKTNDIGWKPLTFLFSPGNSIKTSLEPAGGLDKSVGMLTTVWMKTPGEAQWDGDPGMQAYMAFMAKYMPDANARDLLPGLGYTTAQLTAHILQKCGDNLTRENLVRQASAVSQLKVDLLLPGMTLNSAAKSRNPATQFQMARFDGKSWVPFGGIIDSTAIGR